jgi:archaellum biogenesis protein FlaJ (TadC family)
MKYSEYLHQVEFPVDALLWILLSLAVSFLVGAGLIVILPDFWQLGIILFLVVSDLMIGYPYLKASQRIDQIEEALPDALKQIADTLRAGGTYEFAMREIASSEYGYLKKEMNNVLRKLEEGENFENALKTLSQNVDSRLVQRTVTIIIDSVKSGAGLADILDEISEDVKATYQISSERKTRTMLQVIFMFTAGSMVAPAIFGFVSTISSTLINSAAAAKGAAATADIVKARNASNTIQLGIQGYMLIEVLAASIVISLMREGKIAKSIIYFPILLLIAYVVYTIAAFVSAAIVSSV